MSETKRRAPVPPTYATPAEARSQMERSPRNWSASEGPVRAIENPAYIESDASALGRRPALPLPDYETLFPKKRHGVQGQTRWDHLIAEVNQKTRDQPEGFLGEEMSVDGPEEKRPDRQHRPPSRTRQSDGEGQRPADRVPQPRVHEAKPVSSKKMPPPPKPDTAPLQRPTVDYSPKQRQSPVNAHTAGQRPNASALPGFVGTQTPSREVPLGRGREGVGREVSAVAIEGRTLQPAVVPNIPSQTARDVKTELAVKEVPTARPRQKVVSMEGEKQADVRATDSLKSNNPSSNQMDQKLKEGEAFLRRELVSKDLWANSEQNANADHLFTGKVQEEAKLEDKGMTADDFDQLFAAENQSDPFDRFYEGDSEKTHQQFERKFMDLNQPNPSLKKRLSQRGKATLATHPPSSSVNVKQEPTFHGDATTPIAVERLASRETGMTAPLASNGAEWTENPLAEDPFGTDPFAGDSFRSSDPHRLSLDESGSEAEGPFGGRNLLRAWVSPTEGQSAGAPSVIVSGPASSFRRPHPVKPMSSAENQFPSGSPAVKDIRILDTKAAHIKAEVLAEGAGAYTQLTQEELITLVVKQQLELTKRKNKIAELEEYIDNLLVRVIDEKPSILLGISSSKPA
ncbi:uncharacterized protein rab11fip1a isoform X2 [Gadus chalcogrammus]|uniref:uncharacterized protein rab11fip1a isoform X2 n=1 Tax=Gadus chalcogrammus TaxID=1042646 RepID=UPI0024C29DE1|nr:uncharacterized protein rab11fip1a isoform X2 [Gadus chalcogrammus]XP_056447522.1 uncharacterized protein rab11fip1a isoform X2 [Gadus chalcogrammus]